MIFERFVVEGLAHNSFLIGSDRSRDAVVIDPRRDIDVYVEVARQRNLRLTHAIESHIHADFVSGARELVALGAECVCGPGSNLGFAHREVRDGETMRVGDLDLTFLHTPGHTPEHISVLVRSEGAPGRVFTGDTLFVGAVGRPDLLGEEWTRRLAGDLYDSLFHKLLELEDEVEVHPAHGAGSLCGRAIGATPSSTIGAERHTNPMLRPRSRDEFVAAVLADLPDTPAYFPRMKRINHDGPPVLGLGTDVPVPPSIDARQAQALVERGGALIDLRDAASFAHGHPAGALNLAFGARVGYFTGWVVPEESTIVLLGAAEGEIVETTRQLLRVGYDRIAGAIAGGFDAWREAGLPVAEIGQLSVLNLRADLEGPRRYRVIDVRSGAEWREDHLEEAQHVPLSALQARLDQPMDGRPIAIICAGGYRASLAASLLAGAGVRDVAYVPGGMQAFRHSLGSATPHH